MTKLTKRKSSLAPSPADKKLRNGNGKGQATSTSAHVIDQLCDNTLLRILSYADLRSLLLFTRYTCKYMRSQFEIDPPKTEGSSESSDNQCSKIWPQLLKDLHMCPLDESNTCNMDYIDAIEYRLSLHHTLIASDKRAKAKGKAIARRSCVPLPLRHHYFMPLADGWRLQIDDDDDARDHQPLVDPFALLSGGTGEEYVMIDPLEHAVQYQASIMKNSICFDKSIQKEILDNNATSTT